MIKQGFRAALVAAVVTFVGPVGSAVASPIYLNSANISVALGAGMAAEPFANRSTAASLASVIDAPTAASGEFHTQGTHIWVDGGFLNLVFDFGVEYNLSTVHFWNYHSEGFDVDNVSFEFFNAANTSVGVVAFSPLLGNGTGSDGTLILAENRTLSFPSNVRFVRAHLTGTNNQVDFNNIGFTAELSSPTAVPEPTTLALLGLGLAVVARARVRSLKARSAR